MKKIFTFIMVLILLVTMCACNNTQSLNDGSKQSQNQSTQQKTNIPQDDIVDKVYVYEKDGFGGNFTIEIKSDGTFFYYEGMLSSHRGIGEWTYSDGMLTLFEKMYRFNDSYDGMEQVIHSYSFLVEKDTLIFMDKGLDNGLGNFLYVKVKDGEKFSAISKYKLTLIDNFGLLNGEVEEYYYAGEEVRIYVKFLSGPLACINLNGVEFTHNDKQFDTEIGSEFYSFPMPAQDSVVYITHNGRKEHTNVDCANGKHGWKMPVWSEDGTYRTVECAICGYIEVRYIQQD